jgi:hypothetical protein
MPFLSCRSEMLWLSAPTPGLWTTWQGTRGHPAGWPPCVFLGDSDTTLQLVPSIIKAQLDGAKK